MIVWRASLQASPTDWLRPNDVIASDAARLTAYSRVDNGAAPLWTLAPRSRTTIRSEPSYFSKDRLIGRPSLAVDGQWIRLNPCDGPYSRIPKASGGASVECPMAMGARRVWEA